MGDRADWFRGRVVVEGWVPLWRWLGTVARPAGWLAVAAATVWGWLWWAAERQAHGGVEWRAALDAFAAGEGGIDIWLVAAAAGLCVVSLLAVFGLPMAVRAVREAWALRPWRPFAGGMVLRSADGRYRTNPEFHLRAPRATRVLRSGGACECVGASHNGSEATAAGELAEVSGGESVDAGVDVESEAVRLQGATRSASALDVDVGVAPVRTVLQVMSGMAGLTAQSVETLAWAYCAGGMVSAGEMARAVGINRQAAAKRCQRLAHKGWLTLLGDSSYQLRSDVRADVDLLREAAQRGDEAAAAGIASKMGGRPFGQVAADWLDESFGGQSYRDELATRAHNALVECLEAFPESAAVFESAAERLGGE